MSLSKIGKVSNAVKLLNTAATSGDIATGISSLSNSLRAAGNMSAGVNWISKYGKVLDSGIAYQALKQAFPEESLTEDMLAKIGYTANGAGKVGNASKFSSVGSTFAGLGAFLKSIWPVLAVVGGIAAGTAAWKWADDKFTITKATAKKHSDESAQAYQNAKTELSTKQSQYDTNQDRIHELRATQNRTSDENAELSQLTKENSLLGTQVSVQKKLVDAKAQQQAIDADMNLNKKYTTSQAVASNIMAIARPDEKNLEGIKENLKDIFDISADLNEGDNFVGPSGNLYNFFKDKTDKQIEDFWNYYSDQGLDGSDWNYMDLASNFNKSQEKAKIEAESKTFSSLFKNSAEDTAIRLMLI